MDIAVIGMSCRFPGASDTKEYWSLLRDGVDAIRSDTFARWDDPELPDGDEEVPAFSCGLMRNVEDFDASFFDIPDAEALLMDPMQRVALEQCWIALESANISGAAVKGSNTGVYIGASSPEYCGLLFDYGVVNSSNMLHLATGAALNVINGRISFLFGLEGPSLAIDTACSSSLVAIHTAIQGLRRGECDMAIAGGVSSIISPQTFISLMRAGMLSPSARCRTFDESADGYVRSEGCGIIVLKRLDDAIRAGDRIRAVLKGSAVNQDGRSSSLTAPSSKAQQRVVQAALRDAQIAAAEVDFVECHGTGTQLGDPIEVNALAAVQSGARAEPLLIGSAKSNIGHCEAASGIAGLIKTILALEHELIPAQLHYNKQNPFLDLGDRVRIAAQPQPWVAGARRRTAGVSSFGFSGTNAHVIVADAVRHESAPVVERREYQIYKLSAKSPGALAALVNMHRESLDTNGDSGLEAIAVSANVGRADLPRRKAFVAKNARDLVRQMELFGAELASGVAVPDDVGSDGKRAILMFAGQGSQYPGMGAELYATDAVFRSVLDDCNAQMADLLDTDIREVLWGAQTDKLRSTQYLQPALFSLEYALACMWKSYGVRAATVLGHSIGEYAAACFAEVMSLRDALKLVCARGRMMEELTQPGRVIVVLAARADVEPAVHAYASQAAIACENSPGNTVVAGSIDAIAAVQARLEREGRTVIALDVSRAFHSPLMRPMLEQFERVARAVSLQRPKITMISTVTGRKVFAELATPEYWVNQIEATVRFASAFSEATKKNSMPLLEVGPGSTLLGLGRQIDSAHNAAAVASLSKDVGALQTVPRAIAALYGAGVDIDWQRWHGESCAPRRFELPSYPFDRKRFWPERLKRRSLASNDASKSGRACSHPQLRRKDGPRPTYEFVIDRQMRSFLAHHRVKGHVIVPATGLLDMLGAAVADLVQSEEFSMTDVEILQPLFVPEAAAPDVQICADPVGSGEWAVILYAREAQEETAGWTAIARAKGGRLTAVAVPLPQAIGALPELTEPQRKDFYEGMERGGIYFGDRFKRTRALWDVDQRLLVEVASATEQGTFENAMTLHPALTDGVVQGSSVLFGRVGLYTGKALVPTFFQQLNIFRKFGSGFYGLIELRETKRDFAVFDVDFYSQSGEHLGQIRGARSQYMQNLPMPRVAEKSDVPLLHQVRWRRTDNARPLSTNPDYLLLAGTSHESQSIVDALEASIHGAHARLSGYDNVAIEAVHDRVARSTASRATKIVCCWPLDAAGVAPAALTANADALFTAVLGLVQRCIQRSDIHLVFVTRNAQHVGSAVNLANPVQSALVGLLRSAIQEAGHSAITLVDLDHSDASLHALVREMGKNPDAPQVALRAGQRFVPAFAPIPIRSKPEARCYRLETRKRGVLDNLSFNDATVSVPTGRSVRIRPVATGLNFIDVLNALGQLPAGLAPPFGHECAGIVDAVGPDVTTLRPGEHVMALGTDTFSSQVLTDERFVARIPKGIGFEQAATLPNVFVTALVALEEFGRLDRRRSILVHAGAGGVGLAAIRVSLAAGLVVYATAGSDAKRELLLRLGVRKVFDSRATTFGADVLAATDGHGVDLVLNSLTGEAISAGFDALANGGCFIEIGKTNVWTVTEAQRYRPDVEYHIVDLLTVGAQQPEVVGRALAKTAAAVARRDYAPLPVTVFEREQTHEAFRFMAQGAHVGKVVVRHFAEARNPIAADAMYLVTGGLGDLGMLAARRLIDLGARALTLTFHKRKRPGELAQVEEWRAAGLIVDLVQVDMSQRADVQRLIAHIGERGRPLAGIVHAAGVLSDAAVENLDAQRLFVPFGPKALGAWHLHELTQAHPLDFFLMYSSISSVIGNAGQANYSAANAFLDALAHLRAAQGLPALSVNWGPWAEIGMAAQLRNDVGAISATMGAELVGRLLSADRPQLAVGPFRYDVIASKALGLQTTSRVNESERTLERRAEMARIAALAPEDRADAFAAFVVPEIARLLNVDAIEIDPAMPLKQLGLDSLLAIQLRNFLHEVTGTLMPATLLFDYPAVETLVEHVVGRVFGSVPKVVAHEPGAPDILEDFLADVESIASRSDRELESMIGR